MNYRVLKKNSRDSLKYHLFISILVCFISSLIISNGYRFNTTIGNYSNDSITKSITKVFLDNNNINFFEIIFKRTPLKSFADIIINYKPTRGVLSVFFNQITGSGSIVIGTLKAGNYFIFRNSLPSMIIFIVSLIIYLFLYIFVQKEIIVGKSRYFLEHLKYQDTSIDKILFIYRVKRVKNVSLIMVLRDLKLLLWSLTIIMFPIKYYEYFMIPYLLAENPDLTINECFELSKKITDGNKFSIFKLDISLIFWYILGYLTLGISNIFYFNPYKESIYANVYMYYRSKIYNDNKELFKDDFLDGENQKGEYPTSEYYLSEIRHKKWFKTNYKPDYSLINLILIFFVFSIFGYIWEVIYTLLNEGILVNRGTMYGPWIPIYGWGAIITIILLSRFKDKPFKLFLYSFCLSGIIEYLTSLYLDIFYNKKWWDYKGYFLNINGRVCLEGLLVFALAGCISIYFFIPHLNNLLKRIKKNIKIILIIILICFYSVDFICSTFNPNSGNGITIISKQSK